MRHRYLAFALAVGFAMSVCTPSAKADEWDKRTVFTFNQPVEVPRAVGDSTATVLGPGTYVMKLMDSASTRNIVQVWNRDESHMYVNAITLPIYRTEPTDKTVLTFEERPSGAPQALHNWYYPGDYFGHQFVYGKTRQVASLEPANFAPRSPEPSIAPATSIPSTEPAETRSAPADQSEMGPDLKPGEEPVQVAQATPQEMAQANPPASAPSSTEPKELPKTASDLPLIGLLGLGAAAAGLIVRRAARS